MMSVYRIPNIKFSSRSSAITIYTLVFVLTSTFLCDFTHAATRQLDLDAKTIYYRNQPPNSNGDFHFEFQTTNGITTKAAGNKHGFSGVIQYVSSEGIPVTMTYVADADGYHPMGDYIHPVPEYVQRSLDYIRTHPVVDEKRSRRL